MRVRAQLNLSLDGRGAGPASPDDPMGPDWGRLVAAYAATRTFRSRVLGITDGSGTTDLDETFAQAYFREVGAEVMGAGMFGFHAHPDDPDWRGWWGETPPFDVPVFVLTGTPRDDLVVGGTTFHFLSATPHEVLDRAVEASGRADVRVGGGHRVIRDFLAADLVDELHVAIAPVVLGEGPSLWDGLRGLEDRFETTVQTADSGTTHVLFRR